MLRKLIAAVFAMLLLCQPLATAAVDVLPPSGQPAGNSDLHQILQVTVVNRHVPTVRDYTMTKIWDDEENIAGLRSNYTVQLYANGVPCGSPVTLPPTVTTYTWTDLYVNEAGQPIDYTVDEVGVPAFYTKQVNGSTITNFFRDEIGLTVRKEWIDAEDADGIRPDHVTIHLLADGVVVDSADLCDSNGWTHNFVDLPMYRPLDPDDWSLSSITPFERPLIVYSVVEENVPGYTAVVSNVENNTITISNVHEVETMDIAVDKVWNDHNNYYRRRPAQVVIHLLANGTPMDTLILDKNNGWRGSFDAVPVHSNGSRIVYTIEEDTDPNYVSQITGSASHGFTVTNTQVYLYDFDFYKVWQDDLSEHETPSFILYNPDGTVHRNVDQPPKGHRYGRYTYSMNAEDEYFVKEVPMAGYITEYHNSGDYAHITDRLYAGGTIINIKLPDVPKTGDNTPIELYLITFIGAAVLLIRYARRRGNNE